MLVIALHLSLFYLRSSALTSTQSYSFVAYGPNEWPGMVFKSLDGDNMVDCGGACAQEAGICDLFSVADSQCYLAQTNRTDGSIVSNADDIGALQFFVQEDTLQRLSGPVFYPDVVIEEVLSRRNFTTIANTTLENCEMSCFVAHSYLCNYFLYNSTNKICDLSSFQRSLGSYIKVKYTNLGFNINSFNSTPEIHDEIFNLGDHSMKAVGRWMHLNFSIDDIAADRALEICASFCQMAHLPKTCNVFALDNQGKLCRIGRYGASGGPETYSHFVTVYSRNERSPSGESYFTKSSLPQTDWARKVYRRTESILTDESRSFKECSFACYVDQGPCFGFVHDPPNCYFMDENVDTDLVTDTIPRHVYSKDAFVNIMTGGRTTFDETNDDNVVKDSKLLVSHGSFCDKFDIPNTISAMYKAGGAVLQGKLHLCKGLCETLEYSSPIREWQQSHSMFEARESFALWAWDDTFLFALGGKSGTTYPLTVDKYDPTSNSWTQGIATLPTPGREKFCAVEVSNVLWLLGGSSAGNLLDLVLTFDPSQLPSDPWTQEQSLPISGDDVVCGIVRKEKNDQDWLVIVLGQSVYYHIISSSPVNWLASSKPFPDQKPRGPAIMSQFHYAHKVATALYYPGTILELNHTRVYWYKGRGYFSYTNYHDTTRLKAWSTSFVVSLHDIWTCKPQYNDWELLVEQRSPNYFTIDEWHSNRTNAVSTLSDISNLACNGVFHFRLIYPKLGFFNEWRQSSDPTQPSGSVVQDYKPLAIKFHDQFIGLRYDNVDSLLVGSAAPNTDFAVGSITSCCANDLLKGPPSIEVDHVKLYARKDC